MTDRAAWAAELAERADDLRSLSADDLRADPNLEDRFGQAIHRFDIPEAIYLKIEEQVAYPPRWENLGPAVEVDNPYLLWANMFGWVAQGRWFDGPLARVHQLGWLEPALRRLAQACETMDVVSRDDMSDKAGA